MIAPLLFLDIDGVMNTTASCLRYRSGLVFAQDAVETLSCIVRDSDCDIVITSTRRHTGITALKGMFVQNGMPQVADRIIGATPLLTDSDTDDGREDEIQTWLDLHQVSERYAILDDKQFTSPIQHHLVQAENDHGLVRSMIPSVLGLLGANSIRNISRHLD